jgi:Uracil DNA glycosylase superfamily
MALTGVRLTAPVHCAPPQNAPTPAERRTCGPWFGRELDLVAPDVAVVLGGFGWQSLLETLDEQGWALPRARPRRRAQARAVSHQATQGRAHRPRTERWVHRWVHRSCTNPHQSAPDAARSLHRRTHPQPRHLRTGITTLVIGDARIPDVY